MLTIDRYPLTVCSARRDNNGTASTILRGLSFGRNSPSGLFFGEMNNTPSMLNGGFPTAKHSRRKSEMVTALAEADQDPDFWQTIIDRISDGEFISTIAQELKVNHSILRNWIRGNMKREQEFQQAERDGKQARIQAIHKKIHETAIAEVEAEVTRMEQLRAAEIALRQQDHEKAPTQKFGDITINFVAAKDGKQEKVIESD